MTMGWVAYCRECGALNGVLSELGGPEFIAKSVASFRRQGFRVERKTSDEVKGIAIGAALFGCDCRKNENRRIRQDLAALAQHEDAT